MTPLNVIPAESRTMYDVSRVDTSVAVTGQEGAVTAPLSQSHRLEDEQRSEDNRNATPPASALSKNLPPEEVDRRVENLNAQLDKLKNFLRFEKDMDSDKMLVMVKNGETGEVIRQIPSEEFLNISKSISEFLDMQRNTSNQASLPTGLLTNEKA